MRALAAVLLLTVQGPVPWDAAPHRDLVLEEQFPAQEAALLETVTWTVDLFWRGEEIPSFAPAPAGFEVEIASGPPVRFGDGHTMRIEVRLRPIRLGDLEIPPIPVAAGEKEIATEVHRLTVTSLLGDDAGAVEDPDAPFAARTSSLPWFLGTGAALLLAALLIWWYRRPREHTLPDMVDLSPHVTALRALARLRASPRTTPAEVEQFYIEVSRILRAYVEAQFGLHAPERTTDEFLAEAERDGVFSRDEQHALRRFLGQCDLVKFAGFRPGADVHDETFGLAEEFVATTRPDRPAEVVT